MLDFLHISFVDVLDILLVAFIFYYAFRLLRGSQAMRIFLSIAALYAVRILCSALNMKLMSGLLGAVLDVGLIALIVIFQPEIRHFLSSFGTGANQAGINIKFINKIFGRETQSEDAQTVNEICKACEEMSRDKVGALIVIKKTNPLKYIIDTGDIVDARLSKRLLLNLFFKNSPLHDGAVIVDEGRVVAARCTLPITEREVPAQYGMRHKAAIGISEATDAQVIVVSEETGSISVVSAGLIQKVDSINTLKLMLQNGR